MPDMDGLEVLKQCKQLQPGAEFILMTAYASVPTAIEALQLGAYDYLVKPFDPESARAVVLKALGRAVTAPDYSPPTAGKSEVLPGIVSQSTQMDELGALVKRVARSEVTTLLLGETGTGKERVARAIHELSPRSSRRFVAVNCAAIPVELLESELFGHAKGAFTGAGRDRAGLFEESNRGTLFLDEIAEMRMSLQAKITRALEERAVRRLAESIERPVDVRLVAATHRDIEAMVNNESFREDLWYRLNVAVVRIPPLRERREDIELLATHFLRESASVLRESRVLGFTSAAMQALVHHDWPGNVRQLRAAVERAIVVATGDHIDAPDLPPEVLGGRELTAYADFASLTWAEAIEKGKAETARQYLEEILRRHEGRVADAAAQAGVERESFYRLMKRYNVVVKEQRTRPIDDNE
jgi:two-component system response regulator HydG